MRNVYKFLRASILILILVGGTYFIAQEYSAGIENAVNTSAGGQSLTKETITNLGDVLATVEAEIAGGAGSEKTNDTVKSDLHNTFSYVSASLFKICLFFSSRSFSIIKIYSLG